MNCVQSISGPKIYLLDDNLIICHDRQSSLTKYLALSWTKNGDKTQTKTLFYSCMRFSFIKPPADRFIDVISIYKFGTMCKNFIHTFVTTGKIALQNIWHKGQYWKSDILHHFGCEHYLMFGDRSSRMDTKTELDPSETIYVDRSKSVAPKPPQKFREKALLG